jgi:Ni,Fe-hydrogenase III small subunit
MTDKLVLREHAMDKDTLVLQCGICGKRGRVMSRNFRQCEREKAWLPMAENIPQCEHFVAERLSAADTPFNVRETQTVYITGANRW